MNIRKANDEDKKRIAEMIAKNETDRAAAEKYTEETGKPPEEFFFEGGSECIAAEAHGATVYFRLARSLRLNATLDPDKKRQNAVILGKFTEWIAWMAKQSGFREVVFATESEPLADFEKNRGFQDSPKDLVMSL